MVGTVTRVFLTRGFAFIRGDDNPNGDDSEDYFAHVDEMRKKEDWEHMRAGRQVTFEPGFGGKSGNGKRALQIELTV